MPLGNFKLPTAPGQCVAHDGSTMYHIVADILAPTPGRGGYQELRTTCGRRLNLHECAVVPATATQKPHCRVCARPGVPHYRK